MFCFLGEKGDGVGGWVDLHLLLKMYRQFHMCSIRIFPICLDGDGGGGC